jgi:spermidine synthase
MTRPRGRHSSADVSKEIFQTPSGSQAPPWSVFLGVCLISLSVLIFEISLVRLLSVLFHFRFVFAVVSFSILGLGVGALLAAWNREMCEISAAGFGVTQGGAVVLIFCTPLLAWLHPLVVVCLILALPFGFAGWFLAGVFTRWPRQAGRLYAADLLGAALGCPASIALMNFFGPVNAILTGGICSAVAGLIVASSHAGRAVTAAALVSCLAVGTWSITSPFARLENIKVTWNPRTTKQILRQLHGAEPWRIVASNWDALSRADVLAGPSPDFREVYNDGGNPSFMICAGGAKSQPAALRKVISFLHFQVWPARPQDRMLCIGSGGGLDVLLARLAGVREIVAVDINSSLPRLLETFRGYHGDVYGQPGTTFVVEEGRHFLRRQKKPFDVIYVGVTQSATAGGQGMAVVESYIHTVEAFEDALNHLTPDGRLVAVFDRENQIRRGALTALEAVNRVTKNPSEAMGHVAVVSQPNDEHTPYNHLLIVKRSPLTPRELASVNQLSRDQKYVVQFPNQPPFPAIQELMAAASLGCADAAIGTLNVTPVHDDNPFFFDFTFGVPTALWPLLYTSAILTAALVFVSFLLSSRRSGAGPSSRWLAILVLLLGIGFMLVQNVLIQRFNLFLGYPTLSLSVVIFSMLMGGSLGSLIAHRLTERGQWRRLANLGVFVIPLLLLLNYGAPAAMELQLGNERLARIVFAALWILPIGFLMGIFFPTALLLARKAHHPNFIPLLWAINGTASVLGGTLTMSLAKVFNYTYVLNLAAGCYALAVLLILRLAHGGVSAKWRLGDPDSEEFWPPAA